MIKAIKARDSTTQILVLGSSLSALLIGLKLLQIIAIDVEPVTNGIMLMVLGLVFLSEFLKTRKNEGKKMSDVVVLILVGPTIIFGILETLGYKFSDSIYGAIGLLYIVLTGVMIFSVYGASREKREETDENSVK